MLLYLASLYVRQEFGGEIGTTVLYFYKCFIKDCAVYAVQYTKQSLFCSAEKTGVTRIKEYDEDGPNHGPGLKLGQGPNLGAGPNLGTGPNLGPGGMGRGLPTTSRYEDVRCRVALDIRPCLISGFICRISGRISGWPYTGYSVAE